MKEKVITLQNTLSETDAARRLGYSLRSLWNMRKTKNPFTPKHYICHIGGKVMVRYLPEDLDKWIQLARTGRIPKIRGDRKRRKYVAHYEVPRKK